MFTMTTKAFQLEVAGRMVSHRPCVAFVLEVSAKQMQSSCQVSFNQCHYTESNSFYITPVPLPWTPMFHFHSFIVGINGVRWLLCTDVAKQKDTGWVGLNKKKATRA